MIKANKKEVQGGVRGITPSAPNHFSLQDILIQHVKIEAIDNVSIGKYIPYLESVKMRSMLNVLIAISVFNNPTHGYIYKTLKYNHVTTKKVISHLLKCGLVREVGKPRLIKPFQRYKVERGFTLTIQGTQALRKLLGV